MPDEHEEILERLLPVLVRIQARLDEDLSLDVLAAEANLSPHHFHRLFRTFTGETPKQYCQRLRVERAAFRLLIYAGSSILDVALGCGFKSHETFTRAFGKHFGISPREYRASNRRRSSSENNTQANQLPMSQLDGAFELSQTTVREFDDIPVAFIRHVGPYEDVNKGLWNRLVEFASEQGWNEQVPLTLMGIAYDAPGLTPPELLRFDAAILAPGIFTASGEVGSQVIRGGIYGITTHVGHHSTLASAYRTAFQRLTELRRYRVVGLPCVEIFHSTSVSALYELNQTDVYIPLELA